MDVLARVQEDDLLADPYPYLAWLRENHPVHRTPAGFYLVATHADCLTVTGDAEKFRGPLADELPELFPLAKRYSAVAMMLDVVPMKNPPEHTRLRRLFNRDFTPRRIKKMRDDTARRCERMIDDIEPRLRDGETVDLSETITRRLPEEVVYDLLGLPDSDWRWLHDRFRALESTFIPHVSVEVLEAADTANDEVRAYFVDLIDQRRRTPAEGMLSDWVQAHDNDPDLFSYEEMMSMSWGLISGGTTTTWSGLGSGVLAMLRHPEHNSWLEAGDAEARSYANEVLRHDSPSFVAGIPRFAVEEIELSGVVIPAGAEARTLLGAANRDPAVFPDPDRFDPARETIRSLSLGHGIRYCLGSHVALQQLITMLPALHRRFPTLELAGELRWRPPMPVRGVSYLPVRLAG